MRPITYTPKKITVLVLLLGICFSMLAVAEPAPPKNICLQPNGDCFTAQTQTPPPPPPPPAQTPEPAPAPTPAPTGNKKAPAEGWMLMVTSNEDSELDKVSNSKSLTGVTVSHAWKELEPERDKYIFNQSTNRIDHEIQYMKNKGKSYQMMITTTTFSGNVGDLPNYLTNPDDSQYDPKYDGGIFLDAKNEIKHASGQAIPAKLDNPAVMDRLKKLITRLGNKYDGNPTFKGLVFQETSYPINCSVVGFDDQRYFDALIDRCKAAKAAFKNTPVYQRVNYWACSSETKFWTDKLMNALVSNGCGVGFPDVHFRPDSNLDKSIFPFMRQLAKNKPAVPTECSVQWDNYELAPVTRIFDFIRNDIKPHHCNILPRNQPVPWFNNQVIPYINSHPNIR